MSHYIVEDYETGGSDKDKTPITQAAMLALNGDTFKEINRFETFVKPYADLIIDPTILAKTAVTMNDVKKGLDVEEMVNISIKFAEKIAKLSTARYRSQKLPILVGHNITFDIAFKTYAFEFCGKNICDYYSNNNGVLNYIDTQRWAELMWRKEKINLTACLKRIGHKLIGAHGAMSDVLGTAELLKYYLSNASTSNQTTQIPAAGAKTAAKQRKFFQI